MNHANINLYNYYNNFVNLHIYNLIDTNDFGIVIGKIEFFFFFFFLILYCWMQMVLVTALCAKFHRWWWVGDD